MDRASEAESKFLKLKRAEAELAGPPRAEHKSRGRAAWFDKVEAPEKHLVWFKHSGHMPMTGEPGKIFLARALCPAIAERAGDIAPRRTLA